MPGRPTRTALPVCAGGLGRTGGGHHARSYAGTPRDRLLRPASSPRTNVAPANLPGAPIDPLYAFGATRLMNTQPDQVPTPEALIRALIALGHIGPPLDERKLQAAAERAGGRDMLTLELVHLLIGLAEVHALRTTSHAIAAGYAGEQVQKTLEWFFHGAESGLALEKKEGLRPRLFATTLPATRLANLTHTICHAEDADKKLASAAHLIASGLDLILESLSGLTPLPGNIAWALQNINAGVQQLSEQVPELAQGSKKASRTTDRQNKLRSPRSREHRR